MNLAKLINTLGSLKNLFYRMTFCVSHSESAIRQSKMLRPLGERHGLPVIGQPNIIAFVDSLYFAARPLAIFLAVVAVVVFALKGPAFWRQTHVSVEVLKLTPSLTHFYTATAVVTESMHIGIGAPAMHSVPHVVNGCFAHAVRSSSIPCCVLAGKAAARGGIATPEVACSNGSFFSARAFTKPFGRALSASINVPNGREVPILSSANVNVSHASKYLPHSSYKQAGAMT